MPPLLPPRAVRIIARIPPGRPYNPAMTNAPPNVRRLALLLGGLAMFGPFSIDTIFPGFPSIGADLGADPFRMQQTISVYLVACDKQPLSFR